MANNKQAQISQALKRVSGILSKSKTLSPRARLEADARARQGAILRGAGGTATPEELAQYPTLAELRRHYATGPCECGGAKTFRVDVPANHPAYRVSFACSCVVRARAARLGELFPAAGIPTRFLRFSFASHETLPGGFKAGKVGALALARRFADVDAYKRDGGVRFRSPSGRDVVRPGALLYGPYGTGKTVLASLVAHAWQDAGLSVLWITYLDFVKAVQQGYADGASALRIEAARGVDLLVMDDLGRDRQGVRQQSGDKTDIFDQVVTHRHAYEMATLFTSNLGPEQLAAQFDVRVTERIVYELCHAMPVAGKSLRLLSSL